jgi:hypothetical protein
VTLVRQNFPDANAAEYSNTGHAECDAVYNATGLIYDPTLQTCLFDDSWPASSQDRCQLLVGAGGAIGCQANISDDLNQLKAHLKAAHVEEINELRAEMTRKLDTMLEKLLENQRSTT